MRDKWYADNRDVVKWGVLLRLAEGHNVTTILQVAYYRETAWDETCLLIDGKSYALPSAVRDHFRRIQNIAGLKSVAEVIVFDPHFSDGDRSGYLQKVLAKVEALPRHPAIVFLDPDTGLEAKGRARPEHVRDEELRVIWDALRHDDLLVFYQHRMRSRSWLGEKQAQFEKALGLESSQSKVAQGKGIAPDVAFFYCRKV